MNCMCKLKVVVSHIVVHNVPTIVYRNGLKSQTKYSKGLRAMAVAILNIQYNIS